MTEPKVSPTEDLIMEVLAARYRLGEHLWPFTNIHRAAATRLEERGWIWVYSGVVENTFRLGLSAEGIKAWKLDRPYTPPKPPVIRQSCVYHPEVGIQHACARCRVGRVSQCILLEP